MRKVLSNIIAAVTAAAMLVPMSGSALFSAVDGDSEEFKAATAGYTEIEDVSFFTTADVIASGNYYVYVNGDTTEFVTFTGLDRIQINAELKSDTDKEAVETALYEQFGGSYDDVSFLLNKLLSGSMVYSIQCKGIDKLTVREAAEWLGFLKEQGMITAGQLITNMYQRQVFEGAGVNYYFYSDDNMAKLQEYIDTKLTSYSIEEGRVSETDGSLQLPSHFIKLIPPKNISISDQIEAAESIFKDTKIAPFYNSANSESTINCGVVDVYNAVKCDANLDNTASVADSVTILQYIANKEKYPLSAQARFNGDVAGGYDGLTGEDALAIQQMDSNSLL